MCVSFYYFPVSRRSRYSCKNLELISLLSRFDGSVRTKTSINGVYKTNIACAFIRGLVENYNTLGKIQPWPTIHLGENNFPPFPS